MSNFDFLCESYATERLKTLSVWSQFDVADFNFRPEPRARSLHEHLVHQCVSEDTWMRNMLGITTTLPVLPGDEKKGSFIAHYAQASDERLLQLRQQDDAWYLGETQFFDEIRSRAWVFLRRMTHNAHHRGQLTAYLRLLGSPLFSTYGPTADTGGLFQNQAPVLYSHGSVAEILNAGDSVPDTNRLPGPGSKAATERPHS